MTHRVKVTCQKCFCSFELCSDTIVKQARILCPNCTNKFPDEYYEKLWLFLTSAAQIPAEAKSEAEGKPTVQFKISPA